MENNSNKNSQTTTTHNQHRQQQQAVHRYKVWAENAHVFSLFNDFVKQKLRTSARCWPTCRLYGIRYVKHVLHTCFKQTIPVNIPCHTDLFRGIVNTPFMIGPTHWMDINVLRVCTTYLYLFLVPSEPNRLGWGAGRRAQVKGICMYMVVIKLVYYADMLYKCWRRRVNLGHE